jgi:hypothetical protein
MKINPFRHTPTLALCGLLTALNFTGGKIEAAPGASAPFSATKTSFTEVTAQLDPGGNFFLYLGTAQWLENLSTKVEKWRNNFTAMPDLTPDDATNINQAFDLVHHLIVDSGIEDITGMGMSSVEIEKGMFRNKSFLHHYPDTGTGFLWKLAGREPHALTGLDLLPADTAFAVFSDLNLQLLWTVTQDEVAKSGFPQAQEFLRSLPAQFEEQTQLKWDDVLDSVGGEFGLVLTLDESNNIPIPLTGSPVMIPEPGLLLVLKVSDDTIFNRIDLALKSNPQLISVDQPNLKLRTMPTQLPFIGTLRPTAASSGGYLFIASSDALVNDALDVKSGKSPGLKDTDEFKRLSQNTPDQGNQFTYMSERFGRVLSQVQQEMVNGQLAMGGTGTQPQWMQSFFKNRPAFAYAVGVNTPQGLLTVGNSSQSYANLALFPIVAVPAMAAAVTLPYAVHTRSASFQNNRSGSMRNICINNLRQLDAAKNQWALENNKHNGDICTEEDLKPYIRLVNGQLPKCPAGGIYIIGPVGETPKCSVPGHALP